MNDSFTRFLEGSPKVPLSDEQVLDLFNHAAHCEDCAAKLREKRAHADALLEARQHALSKQPSRWSLSDDEADRAAQLEIVMIAKRVFERLTPARRASLNDRPITAEMQGELWLMEGLEPGVFRVALGVSEATLVLSSLLSEHEQMSIVLDGSESEKADLKAGTKGQLRIPGTYPESRIAEHAAVSQEDAHAMWCTLIQVMIDGNVGLPGIFVEIPRQPSTSPRSSPRPSRPPGFARQIMLVDASV